jgi:uncharacterized membrane protein
MHRRAFCRGAALVAYFSLLALLIAWYGWLAPSERLPRSVMLLVSGLPLLLLVRGVIHGRIKSHALASLLSLAYLAHGIVEAYSNEIAKPLALIEIALAVCLYLSAAFYARFRAGEL